MSMTQFMVPRLCLALMFVTALGGTWVVEQPENSMLEYFPAFQSLLAALYQAFGGSAVPTLQKIGIDFFQYSIQGAFLEIYPLIKLKGVTGSNGVNS